MTQVLADGTNTYVYGNGRIAQVNTTSEYFLGDALGSVRQMTDPASEITFTQSYDPYGVVTSTSGESHTDYGYTGESYGDSTQLLYLRARYYSDQTWENLLRTNRASIQQCFEKISSLTINRRLSSLPEELAECLFFQLMYLYLEYYAWNYWHQRYDV